RCTAPSRSRTVRRRPGRSLGLTLEHLAVVLRAPRVTLEYLRALVRPAHLTLHLRPLLPGGFHFLPLLAGWRGRVATGSPPSSATTSNASGYVSPSCCRSRAMGSPFIPHPWQRKAPRS